MYEDSGPSGARITLIAFLGVILLLLIPIAVWQFRVDTADIKGEGDAKMTVAAAPNRLAKYSYFFALCTSVQNAEQTIDSETNRYNLETDSTVKSRILANISAAQIVRANGINTYNAESIKYTSNQFKDSDLPYRLAEGSQYEAGGTHTVCHA